MTLDSTGALVGEQRYYPFGATRVAIGTWPTDRLFTGQLQLASLNLYHFGARAYSLVGRFLSADPLVPDWTDPQASHYPSSLDRRPSSQRLCKRRSPGAQGTGWIVTSPLTVLTARAPSPFPRRPVQPLTSWAIPGRMQLMLPLVELT